MSIAHNKSQNALGGRHLARNTLFNLVSYALPILVGIATIPFIIKGMGTERFGYLTLSWAVIGYFNLFDFGLGRAATKLIGERLGKGEHEVIRPLAYTTLTLLIIFGLIGTLLLMIIAPFLIDKIFNIPSTLQNEALIALQILSVSLPFVTVTTGLRGVLEAFHRFDIIALLRIPHGTWMFISPLISLYFSPSLTFVMALLIAGRIIVALIYFYFFRREVGKTSPCHFMKIEDIKALLSFGGWMSVTNIIGPILIYLDRFIISSLMTLTFVSYYTTPFEIVSRLLIIPAAITGVMFPAMAQTFFSRPEQTTRLYFRGLIVVLTFTFPLVIASYVLADPGLALWLGSEFATKSSLILQILMLGILFNGLAHIPFNLIQAAGAPDITAKAHLAELPIYILLVYYLTSKFGIVGTATAWTIRVVLDAAALFLLSRRYLSNNLKPYMKQIGLLLLSLAIASTLIYKTEHQSILSIISILAFIPGIWVLGLMQEDKQRVKNKLGI